MALIDSLQVVPTRGEVGTGAREIAPVERFHAISKMATDQKDDATADLAVERSVLHARAAWMLRAIAAG